MLPFIITYFILGLVSAVLIFGMDLAYWQGKYYQIARGDFKFDVTASLVSALLSVPAWPFLLPFTYIYSDRAKHGLLFTNPHKKKDMIHKHEYLQECKKCPSSEAYFGHELTKPKEQRCAECGGMFLESKMHKVTIRSYDQINRQDIDFKYYCKTHAVDYDVISESWFNNYKQFYFKTIPAHEVEVDVNGVEIKKKGGK